MTIALLGAPGSGKGTQADLLAQRHGFRHVATGDLVRAAIKAGTPLGQKIKAYAERGDLVPDEVILDMLREAMGSLDAPAGVVIDGYPRTVDQARGLDGLLAERGEELRWVFYIDVPEAELVRRLSDRWFCPQCGTVYNLSSAPPRQQGRCDKDGQALTQRPDDNPETARYRIKVQSPSPALLDYYRARDLLRLIDGRESRDKVSEQIEKVLASDSAGAHVAGGVVR